jgi:hypothetical protein
MPQFNLRQDPETLVELAPYKVLAVMCHPRDLIQRERMMGHVLANSDVEGVARRRPLSYDEFNSEVRICSLKAVVAGGLLLTRLQLHLNGHPFSLNRVMPLIRALLPKWVQPWGGSWPRDSMSRQWPSSRRKMLDAYNHFHPVAHLWAALIHVDEQHHPHDILRWVLHELPTFLAFADSILEMATTLPSPQRGPRFALTRSEVWTFVLPQRLILKKRLQALPLNEQQLAILDE